MIRPVLKLVPAAEITEGAGVTVHRTIGTPALRNLDPFLMLDHFGSNDPDDYIAGFPPHPHRGFITFTYMLDGHMEHQDSMGNRGDLRPGGAQWMKAASGVIHSEMPRQTDGLMRGFQLWINLPAAEKMSDPAYQEFSPQAIPEVRVGAVRVRLLAGAYVGHRGVIDDPHTDMQYLDVALEPDGEFALPLAGDYSAFVYVYEGSASSGGSELTQHSLAVLGEGDEIRISAGRTGVRFICVAGKPINEAIVQHGPFVMNTRAEIELAFREYQSDSLVKKKAGMKIA
jgi:redox-sensitive bicupin YhaK (pirin superfamily)